jgi:drug/metabolite transporter (DMT)-like permease
MPLSALALVITAAVLHALWNIAAKHAGGDQRFALLTSLITCVIWLPPALWLGWAELPTWGAAQWAVMALSAVLHWLYFTTLLKGYRVADLTVVYPVARGSAPLLTAAVAVWLLGEHLGPWGLAGVLAVCGGVFLIAGGPQMLRQVLMPTGESTPSTTPSTTPTTAPSTTAAHQRTRLGLRWGLTTGALIATYSVIDGYAIKVLLMGPVLFDYLTNVLRVPLQLASLGPSGRSRAALRQAWRAQWRQALVVAALGPLAYILVLYALQLAPLSHVAPAREVSMLFAALLGGRLLGEQDRGLRVLGAACIAGGVAALAWV